MPKTSFLSIESLSPFFLHYQYFTSILSTLLGDLHSVDVNIPNFPDNEIVELLLHCSLKFENLKILKSERLIHFYRNKWQPPF